MGVAMCRFTCALHRGCAGSCMPLALGVRLRAPACVCSCRCLPPCALYREPCPPCPFLCHVSARCSGRRRTWRAWPPAPTPHLCRRATGAPPRGPGMAARKVCVRGIYCMCMCVHVCVCICVCACVCVCVCVCVRVCDEEGWIEWLWVCAGVPPPPPPTQSPSLAFAAPWCYGGCWHQS
jgi:hypothetical protein